MEAPILIPLNWQLELHVHIDASFLAIGAMLAKNPTNKYDQSIVYAFRSFNKTKQNYTTIEKKAIVVVYVLHKFNFFVEKQICVLCSHVVLVYFINKP
jgi:hypothetical protein